MKNAIKKEIKSWLKAIYDITSIAALLFLMGIAFGYGVSQIIDTETYVIKVTNLSEIE